MITIASKKSERNLFQSQILDSGFSFDKATTLSPQTTIVSYKKNLLEIQMSCPARDPQLGFHNRFCGNSICSQSAIYTPCVNKLQFIGKMRPGGQKNVKTHYFGSEGGAKCRNCFYGGLFPIEELIKMDVMLRLIIWEKHLADYAISKNNLLSVNLVIILAQLCPPSLELS